MRRRDALFILFPLLALILVVGLSCGRFNSSPSPPEGLQAQAPSSTKTDVAQAKWAGPPPDAKYAGSESCLGCHEESADRYHKTVMGRIMSVNPRTAKEQRNCESCHVHLVAWGFEGGLEPLLPACGLPRTSAQWGVRAEKRAQIQVGSSNGGIRRLSGCRGRSGWIRETLRAESAWHSLAQMARTGLDSP